MDCWVLLLAVGFGAGYLANQQGEWWEPLLQILVLFTDIACRIAHILYAYADWVDENTFVYNIHLEYLEDDLIDTYYEYNTWLVQHHYHN